MAGGYDNAFDLEVSWGELQGILASLKKIDRKFGPRKVKQIARNSAKTLRTEMRNLAPKYDKQKKLKFYQGKSVPYKKGTLKRSVAIKSTRKGILVMPRMGKRTSSVLGKPNLDGYYAHIVVEKSSDGKDFVEKARLAKKDEVLRNMEKQALKLIKW